MNILTLLSCMGLSESEPQVSTPETTASLPKTECYNISPEDKDNRSVIVDYVTDGYATGYTTVTDHPTEKMDGSNICGPTFEAYDFDNDDQVDAYYDSSKENNIGQSDLLIFDEKYGTQAQETTYVKYSNGESRVVLSTNPEEKTKAQTLFDLGNNPGKKLQNEFASKMNTDALRVGDRNPEYPSMSDELLFTDSEDSTYSVFFEQNYQGGSTGDYVKHPINGVRLYSTEKDGYHFFGYHFGAAVIGSNQELAKKLEDQKYSAN